MHLRARHDVMLTYHLRAMHDITVRHVSSCKACNGNAYKDNACKGSNA
jgi:hypothetical protein